MSDEQATTPAPAPKTRRRRRKRRTSQAAAQAARREIKAAAAAVDATAVEAVTGLKPEQVNELDKIMAATGLMAANLPEAEVLAETPEETKAKLTKIEKDQLSLAQALAREAELQANDDGTDDQQDAFWFDKRLIPHGWHYEYRVDTVLNQRDPNKLVSLRKRGWTAVPLDRHPHMMPSDWTGGNYITRGGMILMEIPKATEERLREQDRQKARAELENKLAQLSGRRPGDKGGFERRGQTSRDFGAIQGANEALYAGSLKGNAIVRDGRTIR
jgi:hypothetical protein